MRHSGVHFFDISTSKSGPRMVCFVRFDLEMCFAPQRRALFRHLNCQKWSAHPSVLYILTWKCASRHNGVHFFDISTAVSLSCLYKHIPAMKKYEKWGIAYHCWQLTREDPWFLGIWETLVERFLQGFKLGWWDSSKSHDFCVPSNALFQAKRTLEFQWNPKNKSFISF